MEYVICPNCKEKSVPIGGTECDLCGWKKKTTNVVSQKSTTTPVVDQKTDELIDNSADAKESGKGKQSGCGVKACAKCGEVKTIISRGLCGRCRYQEEKAGTLDKNYPVAGRSGKQKKDGPEIKSEGNTLLALPQEKEKKRKLHNKKNTNNLIGSITINFLERDESLFLELIEAAEYNRRDLPSEVLFRLEGKEVA